MQPLVNVVNQGDVDFAHVVVRAIREGRIVMTEPLRQALSTVSKNDPVLRMVYQDLLSETRVNRRYFSALMPHESGYGILPNPPKFS